MLYPWLEQVFSELKQLSERGQLPHALLLHGPRGTGRRHLGLSLCSQHLGTPVPEPALTQDPGAGIASEDNLLHPDLLIAQPPPDKRTLPIERVRQLIGFLQLTAHQGQGKAALVTPAEALSHAAANSLLKTLEEPPPGSLIVLVADAPARLPPTVLSRCQRVRIPLPPAEVAARWLARDTGAGDASQLLRLAGGAPLVARQLYAEGFSEEAERLEMDLQAVRRGTAAPVAVARRWAKLPPERCLDWLYRRTAAEVRQRALRAQNNGTGALQNGPDVLNISSLFAGLKELGELRRLAGSGVNAELGLTQLLNGWYGEAAPR